MNRAKPNFAFHAFGRPPQSRKFSRSQHLLDRRKFATPPSDGVAPTRAVGSFRSFRPRQETRFQSGTQDWATTTLNALESSCDPQGSTVTHVHQNPDGILAAVYIFRRKGHTIVGGGSAQWRLSFCGDHHSDFQEETNTEWSCGSELGASVTYKTSNAR